MTPVLLKRWSPLFDPKREQIGAGPLSVCLPGLPLQYLCEEVFIIKGNALGTVITPRNSPRLYISDAQEHYKFNNYVG